MRTPLPQCCPPASSSVRRVRTYGGTRSDKVSGGFSALRRRGAYAGFGAMLGLAAVPASAGPASDPADPRALELAWHRCLREASAHQPAGQSRAGDERNALDECKSREDALVAALMAGRRPEDGRTGTVWARTWAAFVEPLTAWIGALRR